MSYIMRQGSKGNVAEDNVNVPNRERWANKFRHRGFWTWEVRPLPDRRVNGILILSSEFTGRKIYLPGTALKVT